MASWYIYSAAAGTASGADWTNAKTTLQAAITAGAAGDTYYVAHDHAETAAAATTITFKGTSASPDIVLVVNRAGSVPPVSADLTTGGSISTTGNNNITFGASTFYAYVQGLTLNVGSGAVAAALSLGGAGLYLKNCALKRLATNAGNFNFAMTGNFGAARLVLDNTTLQCGGTGDTVVVSRTEMIWRNTASAIQGATLPTTLFGSSNGPSSIALDGVDLSALGSGKTLVAAGAGANRHRFINCKFGSSVAVSASQTTRYGYDVQVLNCDSATANYRQEIYDYAGTLTAETTIVPSSDQASDGTTPITWKVVTTANAKWQAPFETFAYQEWIDTTGGAITRTFEMVNDGTTLTNAEVWADTQYLGSSATPLASVATTGTADILAAGSNLSTSSVTWTTTGLGSPVKQYITVTFTPNMKGFYRTVFKFARASKTVYINPEPNEL